MSCELFWLCATVAASVLAFLSLPFSLSLSIIIKVTEKKEEKGVHICKRQTNHVFIIFVEESARWGGGGDFLFLSFALCMTDRRLDQQPLVFCGHICTVCAHIVSCVLRT